MSACHGEVSCFHSLCFAVARYVTSLLSPPDLRINSVQFVMNQDSVLFTRKSESTIANCHQGLDFSSVLTLLRSCKYEVHGVQLFIKGVKMRENEDSHIFDTLL